MKRLFFVSAVAVSLAAGFLLRSLSAAPRDNAPSEAGRAAASAAEGDEWEFCAVARAQFVPGPRGNQYWIVYFRGEGVQTVTVETGVSGNAQGKAIAKLGSEGWELVGEGTLDTGRPAGPREELPRALFFKRPRR
jgi:hypothetical protein